jgi:glycosyltransferase involved in cell wall biosynthesis
MTFRVLLSAFACDPIFGSDEEVGWQWAKQLSDRRLDVTVITRRTHQPTIEARVAETGECANVHFAYVDLDTLHAGLKRINRRNHIYYYFWQWQAYKTAKKMNAISQFDLIHHVTWVSFRQPSFMHWVGPPVYFGPVAGGDEVPPGYTRAFSPQQKVVEWLRKFANFVVKFDPLMRMTYRHAQKVFFTSEDHLHRVPAFVRDKAEVDLAIGVEPSPIGETNPGLAAQGNGKRLLFAGRCVGWKGMDLGLEIFAKARAIQPDIALTIIGDGADRARWMAHAAKLGVSDAVEWRGWLPKDTVMALYPEFDALFYPSLRDSGGFVVLEALQNGLPVICFKLGGPGVVVNDSCGAAVPALGDIEKTIDNFAQAVIATLARGKSGTELSTACRARVRAFTWDALFQRIYGPFIARLESR